ncbi:MAG TPA: metal ABC transporter permease [Acidimicrobiales bacterium]|nr:metal ABC transporter permease [Acidimicrobiales bacterium]
MKHIADLYATDVMRRALIEAVLVGALCGVVGVHVVLRKLPLYTITVAHATFPGIVLAAIAGIGELVGGLGFAAVLVLVVYATGADRRLDSSATVGVALAGSLGLGVMLQSAQAGFTKDLTAVLVGSILTVDRSDLVITVVVGLAVLGTLAATHKELVFRAFDPAGAEAVGYPRRLDLALLAAVAATVVATVPAVGTILAVALLAVPPMTARLVTTRVGSAMAVAAVYGAASGFLGLTASAEWDVAAGASIALAAAALFAVTWAVVSAADRVSARRARRVAALA